MLFYPLNAYYSRSGTIQVTDQATKSGSGNMRKILAVLIASLFCAGSALAQTAPADQAGAGGATGAAAGGVTSSMVAAAVAVAAVAAAASSSNTSNPAASTTTTTTTTQ